MKTHIEKNTVQETLVIPLYGRKLCTEQFPKLFQDKKAVELIERIDYDFSSLEKKSRSFAHRFGALEVAMRENDLMFEAKDYLKVHPRAALVNLGCGLDQTAENCDNGECMIYNLDLPDVIAVRNELLPEGGRIKNIAADLNDFSWFDRINAGNGVCFLAAGVFYYFKTENIKKLFLAMAKRFPGGRLVFDSANKRAVKIMLKTWVKEAGITSIADYFSVDSIERDILPWMNHAKVSSRGYMLGYNDLKDPSVPRSFRLMAKLGDGYMKMQIIRIIFLEDQNGTVQTFCESNEKTGGFPRKNDGQRHERRSCKAGRLGHDASERNHARQHCRAWLRRRAKHGGAVETLPKIEGHSPGLLRGLG